MTGNGPRYGPRSRQSSQHRRRGDRTVNRPALDPVLRYVAAMGLAALEGVGGFEAVLGLADASDEKSQLESLDGLYAFARFQGTPAAFHELHRLARESSYDNVRGKAFRMSLDLDVVISNRIRVMEETIDVLAELGRTLLSQCHSHESSTSSSSSRRRQPRLWPWRCFYSGRTSWDGVAPWP